MSVFRSQEYYILIHTSELCEATRFKVTQTTMGYGVLPDFEGNKIYIDNLTLHVATSIDEELRKLLGESAYA